MNSETFRQYSARLTLVYTRYLDALHAALFPRAPRTVRTRPEKPPKR
jgi:hypothetical protein